MSRIWLPICLILSLTAPLAAQLPFRFSVFGQPSGANLGQGLALGDDFDGDGRRDLLVGAPGFVDPLGNILGAVHAISSADGTTLFSLYGQSHQDGFGSRIISGFDSDQDGVLDFAVSAPRRDRGVLDVGRVYIFSGATRQLLGRKDGGSFLSYFGAHLALAGDIDADGVRDFIIGGFGTSTTFANQGEAMVVSGKTLIAIHYHLGGFANDNFGNGVLGLDDLNGDGFDDYAIAATGIDHDGVVNAGVVQIFSGATGGRLWSHHGLKSFGNYGNSMLRVPDLTGDGVDEYMIGVPTDSTSGTNGGRIELFDGALGLPIWSRNADSSLDRFGLTMATGDFDGDGQAEFLVSAPGDNHGGNGSGSVSLIDGDGSLIKRYDGAPVSYLGQNVLNAGDLEGDGIDDFVMSSLTSQGVNINIGSITLASYAGATVTGPAAAYGLGLDFVPGTTDARQGFVRVSGPNNLAGNVFTSLAATETYLNGVPILVNTQLLAQTDHIGLGAAGLYLAPVDLALPSLNGVVVHLQAFLGNGTGVQFSRRLSLLFGI